MLSKSKHDLSITIYADAVWQYLIANGVGLLRKEVDNNDHRTCGEPELR